MVPDKDVKLICRATKYQNSEENTKHVLIDLPKKISKPCIERLERSGLATPIRNESKAIVSFKSNLDYFHLKKHIPTWKYGNDNISPCETRTFTACRSMHNIKYLSVSGGSCKYCCKYVGKIDKTTTALCLHMMMVA